MRAAGAGHTLGLAWPTVDAAVRRLEALGIVEEVTGRARDRLYAYTAQLELLNAGSELPGQAG